MIYEVNSLEKVYRVLSVIANDGPIAVFDFLSGELGYEFVAAQVFGGEFFDTHKDETRVIALCWKGMSVAYQHVSHDQIEYVNLKDSIRGNRKHQGGNRHVWLMKRHHGDRMREIKGIMAWHPSFAISEKALIMRYGINQTELLRRMINRLIDKQILFESFPGWRAILNPYILIFDRTDAHQSGRNTQREQIELLKELADKYDCSLAVRSGFKARDLPYDILQVLHYWPDDRQLGLLCNLVRNALFFAGPPSGMTTACIAFGCNFLALGNYIDKHNDLIIKMVEERGFKYLGLMDKQVPEKVREFLDERIGVQTANARVRR